MVPGGNVFGCGFNGFFQLSCAQCDSVNAGEDQSGSEQNILLNPECLHSMSEKSIAQIQACWTTIFVLLENGQLQSYGWTPGKGGLLELKEDLLPAHKIKEITCSWDKILLLSNNNEILMWNNISGQGSVAKPVFSGQELNVDLKFKTISSTEKHFLAVSASDKLWSIESDKETEQPTTSDPVTFISRLLLFDEKIQTVSCGKEHSLILTVSGKLYSFGNGSRGQLGHGTTDEESEPRLVEALDGIRLTQVHTGGWHCAVISEFGDLYTWGWNESGQVGVSRAWGEHSDDTCHKGEQVQFQMMPALIDFPGENHVIHANCGSRHTAAITNDGVLWTWGWGSYGQLGHGDRENYSVPTKVKFFIQNKLKVSSVVCGAWNTVMTVT